MGMFVQTFSFHSALEKGTSRSEVKGAYGSDDRSPYCVFLASNS